MSSPTPLDRYRWMARMREFDLACLEGVPTGEIHGELHTGIGQEAIAAGMAGSLRQDDALVSTHRNHSHALAKGVDPRALMAEIYERTTGLCGGYGGHMHPFDPARNFSATGIVGASLPVALGYAYAIAAEGRDAIAVAVTGDAGSNHGTFHECMNIAAAWELPLVVVVENNRYGISVSSEDVIPTATIAERAAATTALARRSTAPTPRPSPRRSAGSSPRPARRRRRASSRPPASASRGTTKAIRRSTAPEPSTSRSAATAIRCWWRAHG